MAEAQPIAQERVFLSVVLPVYNELPLLPELVERLKGVLSKIEGTSEVILVDDGSTDGSVEFLQSVSELDSRFVLVELSRNFGHQSALCAGLDLARGRGVVMLDSDLQDPPELILELVEKWQRGFDVVYAVRRSRKGETWFKKASAWVFYKGLQKLSDVAIPKGVGDYRLVDRKVLDVVLGLHERNRFLRGLFSWVGFRQIGIAFDRDERRAGITKYPLRRMVQLAWNAITGFSDRPLRWVLNFGLTTSAISFLMGVVWIGIKLGGASYVAGWTSIVVLVLFLGGIQLTVLGVMGQYLARIFDESRGRPSYIVSRINRSEIDR